MKLPRDLSYEDLIKALAKLGYETTRQTGSHVRLTTQEKGCLAIQNILYCEISTIKFVIITNHFF